MTFLQDISTLTGTRDPLRHRVEVVYVEASTAVEFQRAGIVYIRFQPQRFQQRNESFPRGHFVPGQGIVRVKLGHHG